MKKTILVTGANKGIGFEMVKQLAELGNQVILTARDVQKGIEAQRKLASQNIAVDFIALDINSESSIKEAAQKVKEKFGHLHVLMNNAAILAKQDQSLISCDWSVVEHTLQTNAMSQLKVIRHFLPLLPKGAKIVMTSSGGGSMSDPVGGWSPAYCVSKTMINAMTRHLALELQSKEISVNAFCPGWVKTDMGGKSAPRSVEQGAETGVWLATDNHVHTGKFFRDKQVIPW